MKNIYTISALCLMVLSYAYAADDKPPQSDVAYEYTENTPYWHWIDTKATRKITALFLVNSKAAGEPYELSKRFNISPDVITVSTSGLSADVLKAALGRNPDVIVLATAGSVSALMNDDTKALLREKVWGGTPLVIFGRYWTGKGGNSTSNWIGGSDEVEITSTLLRNVPVAAIPFSPAVKVFQRTAGKGKVTVATGYDNHWVGFGAFAQQSIKHSLESPPLLELCYAIANQIIMAALAPIDSGNLSVSPASIVWPNPVLLSGSSVRNMQWEMYTKYGESIAQGRSEDTECSIRSPRAGNVWLRWTGADQSYGVSLLTIASPIQLANPLVTAESEGPCLLSWATEGSSLPTDEVEWQIYAPGKRLINTQKYLLSSGKGQIEAIVPNCTTYLARALLLRNGTVMDEARVYFNRPIDRAKDKGDFHVVAWATERGGEIERKRMVLLRELGVTAMATGGQGASPSILAAQEGLRVVPTNVYAPQYVQKLLAGDDVKAAEQKRKEYEQGLSNISKTLRPFSPLGYQLSDEPHGINFQAWRDRGVKTIHASDPDARVGYSGVWAGGDIAPALRDMDYLTGYSPGYLYTTNLWRDVERDLFRNFRCPTDIRTCWTHYASKLDSEPYSRTVPWLWLFEEMDGVSYFDSGGDFAILPGDLSLTHETRWWSEEVRQIRAGIGKQLLHAHRERGQVRIVYSPDSGKFSYGFSAWIRAFNELSIPYAILDRRDLTGGIESDVKLIILPSIDELEDGGLAALQMAAERGCVVITTAPLGILKRKKQEADQGGYEGDDTGIPITTNTKLNEQDCELVQTQRLESLFGIKRNFATTNVKEWTKARALMRGVIVKASWSANSEPLFNSLQGTFCGEAGYQASDGTVVAELEFIGENITKGVDDEPEYIKSIRATPMVISKSHGKGVAYYFSFMPQMQDLRVLIQRLLVKSQIAKPSFQISRPTGTEPTTYLYPFKEGQKRFVGIICDYSRIQPTWVIDAATQKNTKGYYSHGPSWWAPREEILQVPEDLYVYDSRRGKLLGKGHPINLQIQPGRPELLSCLPYQVSGISVSAPLKGNLGQALSIEARINTIPELLAKDHFISIALIEPGGHLRLVNTQVVLATNGEVRTNLQLPVNAATGQWRLLVKDVVSGLQAEQLIEFTSGNTVTAPLPEDKAEYRQIITDWPEGQWARWQDEKALLAPSGVYVKVDPLARRMGFGPKGERNYYLLQGGFSLKNLENTYQVRYKVGNDWIRENISDTRQIIASYPPGLGFSQPNATGWWSNRYLQFSLNGSSEVNKYAIRSMQQIPRDNGGEVRVTWEAQQGEIDLSFVMLPNHPGIFQELTIRSVEQLKSFKILFTTYAGGSDATRRFLVSSEDRRTWQFTGDALLDRQYGKGNGPTGLMILPEEWEHVKFHTNAPSMEKIKFTMDQKQIRFHWILWNFSNSSNSTAEEYMKNNEVVNLTKLRELFNLH